MEGRRDHRSSIIAVALVALIALGAAYSWAGDDDPPPYDTPSTTIVYTTEEAAVVEAEHRGDAAGSKKKVESRSGRSCWLEPDTAPVTTANLDLYNAARDRGETSFNLYCDGEWIGLVWRPIDPGPVAPRPVSPRSVAEHLREEIPMPAVEIKINPDTGLAGAESWFWIEGYEGEPITNSTDAFGTPVEVEARPTSYEWSFGDGKVISSQSTGKPYPERSEIRHVFERASEDGYQIVVRFTFEVRYRTAGGPWTDLPGISRTASATYVVQESQAVIQR